MQKEVVVVVVAAVIVVLAVAAALVVVVVVDEATHQHSRIHNGVELISEPSVKMIALHQECCFHWHCFAVPVAVGLSSLDSFGDWLIAASTVLHARQARTHMEENSKDRVDHTCRQRRVHTHTHTRTHAPHASCCIFAQ
jgi:hypothetical protein